MSAQAAPAQAVWEAQGVTVEEIADRLALQRCPGDGGAPYVRSGVLNLMTYAAGAGEVQGMHEVVRHLVDHQPSRAVVICASDGGEGIDASVTTTFRASGGQDGVALETVRVTLRGLPHEATASAVIPLLRGDLPTVAWWPGVPDDPEAPPFASVAGIADRVVTESGRAPDAAAAVRALAGWVPTARPAVTDLAWASLTGWRQLIAQMLGDGPLAELRAAPARARVVHGPGAPGAEALLLAGWLHDVVGPELAITLVAGPGEGPAVAAVALEGAHGRRLTVERSAGREAATVSVEEPGSATRRRVLPLPHPDRTSLIAGELELQRRDRAFERALAGALAAGVA